MRVTVSSWLRWGLRVDAVASAGTGLAFSLFAHPISTWFHLPAVGVFGVGLFCLLYAAIIGRMSLRTRLPRWAVWAVIGGNAIWAVDSVLLLTLDIIAPNQWGQVFVLTQAAVVFGFAEWQFLGMRRSLPASTSLAANA